VILAGRATRLARFVSLMPKRYSGVIRFGMETDTDDAAGAQVGDADESWRPLLQPELEAALRNVQARTHQVPPAVSAKKVDGVRSYRLARRGEAPALEPARVVIERLRCEWFDRAQGEVHVDVVCSSGTYIRAIARDVGRELGTKAHLASLRRTEIGAWKADDAVKLGELGTANGERLRPMSEAVALLPAVILPADEARRFCLGQKIPVTAIEGPHVAVFDVSDLIGVAELQDGVLKPDVVLAPPEAGGGGRE
jgi:tRNA pseudouridine55 synthase